MHQLTGDGSGNVIPLHGRHRSYWKQADTTMPNVEETVRSFDRLERHAVRLQSGFPPTFGDGQFPIVDFLVQLPLTGRQLDELGRLSVFNCPDTGWVLRLGAARANAMARLRAVDRSLLRDPPGTGPLGERLTADIRRLTDALLAVRRLLAQKHPDVAGTG